MQKLNEYNGRYCESEFEYAFIGFLEHGSIFLALTCQELIPEMFCIQKICQPF